MVGIWGTSIDELGPALQYAEDSIKYGEWCKVQLCTEALPSREALDAAYADILLSGHHISRPVARMVDGVPTTSFSIKKGSPLWPLIIPLIVPVLTIGLITFGVFQIGSITKALVPILLIVGGVTIVTVGLLARPAERVATAYLTGGGQKLLPSTIPKGKRYENPSQQLGFLPQTELVDKVRELWRKACEWERIPPESKFVVFSEKNPYNREYDEAMGKLLRYRQLRSGEYKPAVSGSGKFFIAQVNPYQIKVTRSDRKGEFYIDIGPSVILPEGTQPAEPVSVEKALQSQLHLSKEEARRVASGVPEEIPDADTRADILWSFWENLEAESPPFEPQTLSRTLGEGEFTPTELASLPEWYRKRIVKHLVATPQQKATLDTLEPYEVVTKFENRDWIIRKGNKSYVLTADGQLLGTEFKPATKRWAQTEEREKGWKDFFKGNRVQASIDANNWRLEHRKVSQEKQQELHKSLKTDWSDLVEYQKLQAWGFASGLLSQEEAQQLFQIYGGDNPSPEAWDKRTLAEKIAATKFADELLSAKLKSTGYRLQTERMTLWDRAMDLLKKKGIRSMATETEIQQILKECVDCPEKIKAQIRRDLGIFPLFDAIAMWVQPVDVALAAYEPKVAQIAREVIERYEAGAIPSVKRYWVEKNLPYDTWAIVELWPTGTVRTPFVSKQEAVDREEEIAKVSGWTIRRVESPMERFPKQVEALLRLKPYKVLHYAEGGDLTVQSRGAEYMVMTNGHVFLMKTGGGSQAQTEPSGEIVKMYCQKCGKEVPKPSSFRTPESLRLYMITGLCQDCQDKELTAEYFHEHPGTEYSPANEPKHRPEDYYRELASATPKPGWVKAQEAGRDPFSGWVYPKGTWVVWISQEMFENPLPPFLIDQYVLPWSYEEMVKEMKYFYRPKRGKVPYLPETMGETFGSGEIVIYKGESVRVLEHIGDRVEIFIPSRQESVWVKPATLTKIESKPSQAAVIPVETVKSPEREYIADSPEYLAETVDLTGWRERIDQAFQEAVERVGNGG